MIAGAHLSTKFWPEAMATASYSSSRSPKQVLGGKTPYELWDGVQPNISYLIIFGSKALSYIPGIDRNKIEKTSRECIFVAYSKIARPINSGTQRTTIAF